MKYCVIVAILIVASCVSVFGQARQLYLEPANITMNGKQPFNYLPANFKKLPALYLQSRTFRFDHSTTINAVEKVFKYEEATGGTDVDLYTTIFIKASLKKGGRWMLIFDTNNNKLLQMIYSRFRKGLVYYKS